MQFKRTLTLLLIFTLAFSGIYIPSPVSAASDHFQGVDSPLGKAMATFLQGTGLPQNNQKGRPVNLAYYNKYGVLVYGAPTDVTSDFGVNQELKSEQYRFLGFNYSGAVVSNPLFPNDTDSTVGISGCDWVQNPWLQSVQRKFQSNTKFGMSNAANALQNPNNKASFNATPIDQSMLTVRPNGTARFRTYDMDGNKSEDPITFDAAYANTHFAVLSEPSTWNAGVAVGWHTTTGNFPFYRTYIIEQEFNMQPNNLALANLALTTPADAIKAGSELAGTVDITNAFLQGLFAGDGGTPDTRPNLEYYIGNKKVSEEIVDVDQPAFSLVGGVNVITEAKKNYEWKITIPEGTPVMGTKLELRINLGDKVLSTRKDIVAAFEPGKAEATAFYERDINDNKVSADLLKLDGEYDIKTDSITMDLGGATALPTKAKFTTKHSYSTTIKDVTSLGAILNKPFTVVLSVNGVERTSVINLVAKPDGILTWEVDLPAGLASPLDVRCWINDPDATLPGESDKTEKRELRNNFKQSLPSIPGATGTIVSPGVCTPGTGTSEKVANVVANYQMEYTKPWYKTVVVGSVDEMTQVGTNDDGSAIMGCSAAVSVSGDVGDTNTPTKGYATNGQNIVKVSKVTTGIVAPFMEGYTKSGVRTMRSGYWNTPYVAVEVDTEHISNNILDLTTHNTVEGNLKPFIAANPAFKKTMASLGIEASPAKIDMELVSKQVVYQTSGRLEKGASSVSTWTPTGAQNIGIRGLDGVADNWNHENQPYVDEFLGPFTRTGACGGSVEYYTAHFEKKDFTWAWKPDTAQWAYRSATGATVTDGKPVDHNAVFQTKTKTVYIFMPTKSGSTKNYGNGAYTTGSPAKLTANDFITGKDGKAFSDYLKTKIGAANTTDVVNAVVTGIKTEKRWRNIHFSEANGRYQYEVKDVSAGSGCDALVNMPFNINGSAYDDLNSGGYGE